MTEAEWLAIEDIIFPVSGYVSGYTNELAVAQTAPNPGMSVDVATGAAVVKSSRYINGAVKTVTIDAADSTQDRYDLVVVQRTLNAPASTIITTVHKGTLMTAGTATPPTRTTSATVHEIVLATVFVAHGTTAITNAMITDKRDTTDCGMYAPEFGDLTIDAATGYLNTNGKNIVMGTGKITGLGDPAADQDADTKAARNAAIAALGTLPAYTANAGKELIVNATSDGCEWAARHCFVKASASANAKYTKATEYTNSTTAVTTVFTFGIPSNHVVNGTYRITADLKATGSYTANVGVYVNGVLFTTLSTVNTSYESETADITIPCGGGLVEVKLWSGYTGNTAYVKNFVVSCDEAITVPAW